MTTITTPRGEVTIVPVSTIEPTEVDWLVPGLIARGSLTLLVGHPGVGKSLYGSTLAAKVSVGALSDSWSEETLLLTAEDAVGWTVRPRLMAAGADLDRIGVVHISDGLLDGRLLLPDDIDVLNQLVRERSPALIVIDPLVAFLPGHVNIWRDQDVRTALAPLAALAEQRRIAVVLVAHLNKSYGGDPLARVGGSIGIPAAARSVLLLARDPSDPGGERGSRRVLAQIKSNLGTIAASVSYEIETVTLESGIEVPRLVRRGQSTLTGTEILNSFPATGRSALEEAIEFLEAELAGGPRSAGELFETAAELGISLPTLKRAKKATGVVSEKAGYEGGWLWRLTESGGGR